MIVHHTPRDDLSNKITKSWFITFWTGAEVQGDGCGPPPSYFQNQPSSSSHHPTHTHSHWPHLKEQQKMKEEKKGPKINTDRALHHGGHPLS